MSLPRPNTPWPPEQFADLVADTGIAQAWWEGSHAKLASYYGEGQRERESSYAGGIRGAVGRLFWGRPAPSGEAGHKRLHVPVGADLCAVSATNLLPDPAAFTVPTRDGHMLGNDKAQQRLDLGLNTASHHGRMLAAAESCPALGGVYPRVVWNSDVADHAWIDYVDGDRAIPTFVYGKLAAATFWTVLEDDGTHVLRHFERYEKGRIVHGLYLGNVSNIGAPIPLTEHEETRGIPITFEDNGVTGWIPTGTELLGADYIPNALPNPKWRQKGHLRNLGRSDLTEPAIVGLMDAIDEAYSGLARDIRLAKARLVVSDDLLDFRGPGKGAHFDVDRELFSAIAGGPQGDPILQAHQFAIRVDEHLRSADAFLRQILHRVGYDASAFGLADDGGAMTATEVDSRDRRGNSTHKAKSGHWKAGHDRVAQAFVEIDAAVFRTGAQIGEPVEVAWPDAARETSRQRAETVQLLEAARAVSIETKVAIMWPTWDDDQRKEEVERIKAEQSSAGDPFAVGADRPLFNAPTPPTADPDDTDEPADPADRELADLADADE